MNYLFGGGKPQPPPQQQQPIYNQPKPTMQYSGPPIQIETLQKKVLNLSSSHKINVENFQS